MFNNKNILVTGGTGSFGKRFIETLLQKYKLKKIAVYSRDELKQSQMIEYLSNKFDIKNLRFFIGDVRDRERLTMAMEGMNFVVHAAALKQVPAAEYNPMECIKTNVIGAENVIHSAIKSKVQQVIALSTDKAADPVNLYGATKLLSDKIFVSSNNIVGAKKTKFSVVRYGNVFNSRGSVYPVFCNIIDQKRKYFPITHKAMTRFNLSLQEGINIVINSFKRMQGGEIFVPKIPSIKIVDLAKAMDAKKPIKVIGIRPGEKTHETLCSINDSHLIYDFKDHYVITPSIKFFDRNVSYKKNKAGEVGKKVKSNFEYVSNKNKFLSINEIKKIIKTEK